MSNAFIPKYNNEADWLFLTIIVASGDLIEVRNIFGPRLIKQKRRIQEFPAYAH